MMKEKILVVDDEEDIVNLISHHLGRSGLEVIPAYSGTEISLTGKYHIDILILERQQIYRR